MLSHLANKIKKKLIRIEKIVASASLILLLALSLTQLILRNFFELGFSEFDVISRHLVIFIIFMGASLATESDKHIKIDCLTLVLQQRIIRNLKKPLQIISAVICMFFFYYACQFWLDELKHAAHNEQLALYLSLILPLGFFTLGLHFFLLSLTAKYHPQKPTER